MPLFPLAFPVCVEKKHKSIFFEREMEMLVSQSKKIFSIVMNAQIVNTNPRS